MNQSEILRTEQVADILQTAAAERTGAVMTHLSKGRWHRTKVFFTGIKDRKLHIEATAKEEPCPLNIQVGQPVGVSFQKDHDTYIFESVMAGFQPGRTGLGGGKIVVTWPDRVEKFQRRSYFRAAIPEGLKVRVLFWHHGYHDDCNDVPGENYWKGRLLDLSASGVQIAVGIGQRPNFRAGQFIGLQFTPMPYEKPLLLEAQVRHIAPTADEKNICLGVQLVGLEASVEGREKLSQLCTVVERYRQMNQCTHKAQPSSSRQ